MYATDRKDGRLTFAVSGMLWQRSLVMYDKETDSLWSHILGQAMSGKLKGARLEQVPSVMTTWAEWSKQHPDGTVVMMKPTARRFTSKYIRSLDQFVLGITEGEDAMAWSFATLAKKGVMHDKWQDTPIVVVYDKKSATPRMYKRVVDGKQLTFKLVDGQLQDAETKSTWNLITGRAAAGPLKGTHLVALPAISSFTKAWKQFHPESLFR